MTNTIKVILIVSLFVMTACEKPSDINNTSASPNAGSGGSPAGDPPITDATLLRDLPVGTQVCMGRDILLEKNSIEIAANGNSLLNLFVSYGGRDFQAIDNANLTWNYIDLETRATLSLSEYDDIRNEIVAANPEAGTVAGYPDKTEIKNGECARIYRVFDNGYGAAYVTMGFTDGSVHLNQGQGTYSIYSGNSSVHPKTVGELKSAFGPGTEVK